MKQLVVEMNHSQAGFFVYLQYVLNGILYCEDKADYVALPDVRYGPLTMDNRANAYFEADMGPNMFAYYFSLKGIKRMLMQYQNIMTSNSFGISIIDLVFSVFPTAAMAS